MQSLIGLAILLSAISYYKFHISKDQQENMKFTIICHLAAFSLYIVTDQKGGQMTNNCEFHILLLIFEIIMKFVTGYGWKEISQSNWTLQVIASYNVFSVLSLGCILISDLVVANLLMYLLPGMYEPTLLGHTILHWKWYTLLKVFLDEIQYYICSYM